MSLSHEETEAEDKVPSQVASRPLFTSVLELRELWEKKKIVRLAAASHHRPHEEEERERIYWMKKRFRRVPDE